GRMTQWGRLSIGLRRLYICKRQMWDRRSPFVVCLRPDSMSLWPVKWDENIGLGHPRGTGLPTCARRCTSALPCGIGLRPVIEATHDVEVFDPVHVRLSIGLSCADFSRPSSGVPS